MESMNLDRRHHFGFGIAVGATLVVSVAVVFWATQTRPVHQFGPYNISSTDTTISAPWTNTPSTKAKLPRSFLPSVGSDLCLYGCPARTPAQDQVVTHHILILANNPKTKFADWVAYRITRDTLGSRCLRRWAADPDLRAGTTLLPEDYIGIRAVLGSDRGHQAPLAGLCGSPYWQEANYLSNITPQKTDLNEGAWERLEDAERGLLSENITAIYSLTGTLYEHPMPALPRSRLHNVVPSAYWKVIAVFQGGKFLAAAFIMEQSTPRNADYCSNLVSLNEVERRSHLHLFPSLPDRTNHTVLAQNEFLQALGCG
jgi:endonuclease G